MSEINRLEAQQLAQTMFPAARADLFESLDGDPLWSLTVRCGGLEYGVSNERPIRTVQVKTALSVLRLALLDDEADGRITGSDVAAALGLP